MMQVFEQQSPSETLGPRSPLTSTEEPDEQILDEEGELSRIPDIPLFPKSGLASESSKPLFDKMAQILMRNVASPEFENAELFADYHPNEGVFSLGISNFILMPGSLNLDQAEIDQRNLMCARLIKQSLQTLFPDDLGMPLPMVFPAWTNKAPLPCEDIFFEQMTTLPQFDKRQAAQLQFSSAQSGKTPPILCKMPGVSLEINLFEALDLHEVLCPISRYKPSGNLLKLYQLLSEMAATIDAEVKTAPLTLIVPPLYQEKYRQVPSLDSPDREEHFMHRSWFQYMQERINASLKSVLNALKTEPSFNDLVSPVRKRSPYVCANISFEVCQKLLRDFMQVSCEVLKSHPIPKFFENWDDWWHAGRGDNIRDRFISSLLSRVLIRTKELGVSLGEYYKDGVILPAVFERTLAEMADAGGFYAFVSMFGEAKICPRFPLAFLTENIEPQEGDEKSTYIRVHPAIVAPSLWGLRKVDERQISIPLVQRFLKLTTLLPSKGASQRRDAYYYGGHWFAGLRTSLLAQISAFCMGFPEMFARRSFTENGFIDISLTEWLRFIEASKVLYSSTPYSTRYTGEIETLKLDLFLSPEDLADRMNLGILWIEPTATRRRHTLNVVRKSPAYVEYIPIDPFPKEKVISGIRYELLDSSGLKTETSQLIESILKSQSTTELKNMLTPYKDQLRFVAVIYFRVGDREISPEVWAKGRLYEDRFVLPDGITISRQDYDEVMHVFSLRQQAIAKMHTLKISDLMRTELSNLTRLSQASDFDPKTYLLQLSSLLDDRYVEETERVLTAVEQKMRLHEDDLFSKVLRGYQLRGCAWMFTHLQLGQGVLLADEMGLGKTAQVLALLRFTLKKGQRALIVAPKSLILNWMREVEKFTEGMKVHLWQDGEELKPNRRITLVTWHRLRLGIESLKKVEWDYVVLDEAHQIKNSGTQVSSAVRELRARHRIALTGTPVENRAEDLWNIVDWLNEGYLGSSSAFSRYTSVAREGGDEDISLDPVHKVLQPILLRRLKSDSDVNLSLPDKVESFHDYELTPLQVILYQAVIESVYLEHKAQVNLSRHRAKHLFLKAILSLKQICNHPRIFLNRGEEIKDPFDLFAPQLQNSAKEKLLRQLKKYRRSSKSMREASFENLISESAKLEQLWSVIERCQDEEGGLLIFTQYHGSAKIITSCLKDTPLYRNHDIPFLHGGLPSQTRMALVDEFQAASARFTQKRSRSTRQGPPPILILSLKAGGTGLNLTGASHVIHFDRWWNPAVEDQATDRAHRFGQDKKVIVHQFIGKNTIEETIAELLRSKRALASELLGHTKVDPLLARLKSHEDFLSLVDPKGVFAV